MKRFLGNPNVQGLLVVSLVVILVGGFMVNRRQPKQQFSRPDLPPTATSAEIAEWQVSLQQKLDALPTPTFTPNIPPTGSPTPTPAVTIPGFVPAQILGTPLPTSTPRPLDFAESTLLPTPEFIQNTQVPVPTGFEDEVGAVPAAPLTTTPKYQLPPEQVPLSAGPFDHFWLTRPVDVTANSVSLFYYPYGSSGQGWRVHHGIDLPNPIGQEVRAAGSGHVVWAGQTSSREVLEDGFELYSAYGNFVVIEHDFSWRGQRVWTLYAHLSAIIAKEGEYVETGDVIGLVGTTGAVTGPHVHFEVRIGRNSYFSTRNPMLWMAPYIEHGVVAGRVLDEEGREIDNVLVQLNSAGRVFDRTTTYINPFDNTHDPNGNRTWNVVPDENWQENFVFGDIPAGDYELVVIVGNDRIFQDVRVIPGTTSFVEIQTGLAATPQVYIEPTLPPATAIPPVTAIPTATP